MLVMPESDGAIDAMYRFAELVRSKCARVTEDATTSLGLGRTHKSASSARHSLREAEHALAIPPPGSTCSCLRIRDVLQSGAARGAQPEPEGVPGS